MRSLARQVGPWVTILMIFLSGCASTLRGRTQKLEITSEPSGVVIVVLPGEQRLVTPATIEVSRLEVITVLVDRAGYGSVIGYAEPAMDWSGGLALLGNFLAGGLIGYWSDLNSGAAYGLDPNPIILELDRNPQDPTDRADASSERSSAPGERVGR